MIHYGRQMLHFPFLCVRFMRLDGA